MKYTAAMIAEIEAAATGKVVESLVHDEVGDYWVMTFTDGSELCFRLMSELQEQQEQAFQHLLDLYR